MDIKEYNNEFLPSWEKAFFFLKNLEHALQKTEDYEGAMEQLRCIGWGEECRGFIFSALGFYYQGMLIRAKASEPEIE